jgi:hypothetical protein
MSDCSNEDSTALDWRTDGTKRIFARWPKPLDRACLERWEWQVWEGETLLATGLETSCETAQIVGDSALFHLLSAGLEK